MRVRSGLDCRDANNPGPLPVRCGKEGSSKSAEVAVAPKVPPRKWRGEQKRAGEQRSRSQIKVRSLSWYKDGPVCPPLSFPFPPSPSLHNLLLDNVRQSLSEKSIIISDSLPFLLTLSSRSSGQCVSFPKSITFCWLLRP